jgi:hypothetical protein
MRTHRKEVNNMAKRTITKWWIWGLVIIAVGAILASLMFFVMMAHVGDVTAGFRNSYVPDSFFWTMIGLMALCGIAVVCGIAAQLVAWIGAVINTNRLADKAWFNLLLWGGIVGIAVSPLFGLGALFWWALMVCYLIAGPDGMAIQQPQIATPTAPPKVLLPTG